MRRPPHRQGPVAPLPLGARSVAQVPLTLSLLFPIHHPAHRPRIGRLLTKRAAVGSSPAGRCCRGPPHGPWRSGLAAAAAESSVLVRRCGILAVLLPRPTLHLHIAVIASSASYSLRCCAPQPRPSSSRCKRRAAAGVPPLLLASHSSDFAKPRGPRVPSRRRCCRSEG
ncbi:hypothetical protein PVAP13_3NG079679 [Panicum virgatum]|uniref:Uncharacterized protein n=1 Tax=Panicum virgatum TaxID=38727 RepID=A0A8T0U204_PANVG|nr:hypothetical protein PVAP13_3NG079679 [Panicum virgatum]